MLEEKKLDEEVNLKGLSEQEMRESEQMAEDDYHATLCHSLENKMREIFEQFFKEPKPKTTIFDYGRKLMALEMAYEKEGLNWEEIHKIRRGIMGK